MYLSRTCLERNTLVRLKITLTTFPICLNPYELRSDSVFSASECTMHGINFINAHSVDKSLIRQSQCTNFNESDITTKEIEN